jgi:hypothetical protein
MQTLSAGGSGSSSHRGGESSSSPSQGGTGETRKSHKRPGRRATKPSCEPVAVTGPPASNMVAAAPVTSRSRKILMAADLGIK